MRFFLTTLIMAGAFTSSSAFALHCYELALKDEKGAVVPVSSPTIGLMVGGSPVVESAPPHVTREPVAPAKCPASLVENLRATFNAACPGDDLRKKAAEDNKVSLDVIVKGCNDMDMALQGRDEESYREQDKKRFPNKTDKK